MDYDLIIIGAGPAGYVSAIRAGQSGLKTAIIDDKYVGGMCLNWGCIPTKSILESARFYRRIKSAESFGITGLVPEHMQFDWDKAKKKTKITVAKLSKGIEYLWKKNSVEFIKGRASLISANKVEVGQQILEAKNIIIATGSRPQEQSQFPADKVIELEHLYEKDTLPRKPLLFGRGSTLVELALFFKLIDLEPVVVLETAPILPLDDGFINQQVEKILRKEKIPLIPLDQAVITSETIGYLDKEYAYDAVLNCRLRKATLPEMPGDIVLKDGFIKVNEQLQTSIPNIFAVGDVNGKSFLAHSASAQGLAAVDAIQGKAGSMDFVLHPINIYTEPEITAVGYSEEQLKANGIEYRVSEFSLNANGKAIIEGSSEGLIRVLHETRYQQVMGVQIVASNATDLIAEAGLVMEMEGTIYDFAKTVHAHPTIAEVFMEVGMVGLDLPIHK